MSTLVTTKMIYITKIIYNYPKLIIHTQAINKYLKVLIIIPTSVQISNIFEINQEIINITFSVTHLYY